MVDSGMNRPGKTASNDVLPQAMGPYQAVMLAANGMPAPDRNMADESWGVVEVGHFTTDFGLIQRGRWVEKASGVCPGARVAAEHLMRLLGASGITVDLFEAEEAMRTRHIKHYGKRRDVSKEVDQAARIIADQVVDTAVRLMEPYARQMDGVLVAGGGAHIVYQPLHSRWPHAQLVDNPRFAVAEGLRRFASALTMARILHKRQVRLDFRVESHVVPRVLHPLHPEVRSACFGHFHVFPLCPRSRGGVIERHEWRTSGSEPEHPCFATPPRGGNWIMPLCSVFRASRRRFPSEAKSIPV